MSKVRKHRLRVNGAPWKPFPLFLSNLPVLPIYRWEARGAGWSFPKVSSGAGILDRI